MALGCGDLEYEIREFSIRKFFMPFQIGQRDEEKQKK
jgi:hypothetical protein